MRRQETYRHSSGAHVFFFFFFFVLSARGKAAAKPQPLPLKGQGAECAHLPVWKPAFSRILPEGMT